MSCQSLPKPEQTAELMAGARRDAAAIKIVAFLCNWCSYAGADKAGSSQLPVPAELSVIRVMCSGRVEPDQVLDAFAAGADGVMVLACHPGDCHYKHGNLRAGCRAELLSKLLRQMGVAQERFCFDYVSAAEAEKFSQLTGEFADRLSRI